jgi:ABC-type polysaccharide/polyol phosphate transport system ATPase subunit
MPMAVEPAFGTARPAIVVDGVSKQFRVPQERYFTLKERVLHGFRRTRFEPMEGLHDVSFTVHPGEFLGVVGRNGSGKSTLLKCIAGIYKVDRGDIAIAGRMSTFIELGVGFNPELAARDNIILNAILHGLTRRDAAARVDEVIEFAGLEEFVELKLKNYSSGMYVRLAFAVMVQIEAEILLIDEVLAVGDAAFQQKCYQEFDRMREEGRTILFVSHDMNAVNRFCDRALLLERGEVIAVGKPGDITGEYLAVNFKRERGADATELIGALRDRAAYVADAWIEDEQGTRRDYLEQGRSYVCKARVEFNEDLDDPNFGLVIESARGPTVFATSSAWAGHPTGTFQAGENVVFSVAFENPLAAGRYYVTAQLEMLGGPRAGVVDRRDRATAFVVTGTDEEGSLVSIPHDFSFERVAVQEVSS